MAKLCGAKCKCSNPKSLAILERQGSEALSSYLRRSYCRNHVTPGRNRCRLHGGYSTGPRTEEGKRKAIAVMRAGLIAARAAGKTWKSGPPKGYRYMGAVTNL